MASTALTRTVMRRIIANQPIHHHHLAPVCRVSQRMPTGSHVFPRAQSRAIFSIMGKGSAKPTTSYNLNREEMNIKRSTKALQEAYMLLLVNTRTASKTGLVKNFKEFFKECNDARELITDHQAEILLKVLELLKGTEQGDVTMTVEIAEAALDSMSKFNHGRLDTGSLKDNPPFEDSYWMLARQLSTFIRKNDPNANIHSVVVAEVRCFAQSGHADLAEEHLQSITDLETWKTFIKSQMVDPSGMMQKLKVFQEFGPEADDEMTSLFIQGFVRAGQSDLARRMLHGSGLLKLANSSIQPASDILQACLEFEDSPTAIATIAKVESALERDSSTASSLPGVDSWHDLYALYHARGEGIEGIEKVLSNVKSRHNHQPTIKLLNLLIKSAYQANNTTLARSIIELAKSRHLELNGYTFLPQVLHKLRNGDLDGALATWDYILYDLEPLQPEDMAEPMEELLIGILSASEFRDYQFDEILHNHPKYARRFKPETVAVLLGFYLRKEEYDNVALLMRKHAPHFTSAARVFLLDEVMKICRDDTITDDCVRNIYMMMKALFDGSSRATREEIFQICVKRDMTGKALEVFTDMRDHWLKQIQPTESTYLIALRGLTSSWEAIMTVHNSLKLDLHVDPSTKLLNALMQAYTRCGQDEARNAVEFWDELLDMKEGPNEDSVVSVLEACSVSPAGYQQARHVWDTLAQRNIDVTDRILGAYINNFILTAADETTEILNQELSNHGVAINEVLQSCFNSAIDDSQRIQIASWLENEHSTVWQSSEFNTIRADTEVARTRLIDANTEIY